MNFEFIGLLGMALTWATGAAWAHHPTNLINSSDQPWTLKFISNSTRLRINVEQSGSGEYHDIYIPRASRCRLRIPAQAVVSIQAMDGTGESAATFHLLDHVGIRPDAGYLGYFAPDPGIRDGESALKFVCEPRDQGNVNRVVRHPAQGVVQILQDDWASMNRREHLDPPAPLAMTAQGADAAPCPGPGSLGSGDRSVPQLQPVAVPVEVGQQALVGGRHQRRGDHEVGRGAVAGHRHVPHHRDPLARGKAWGGMVGYGVPCN